MMVIKNALKDDDKAGDDGCSWNRQ